MNNKVITKAIVLADGCVVMVGYQTDSEGTQTGFVEANNCSISVTRLLDDCNKVIDVVEVFDNVILLALLESDGQYSNHVHFVWRKVITDDNKLQIVVANDYPQLLTTDKLCKFICRPKSIAIAITEHRMMLMLNDEGFVSNVKSIESDDDCNSEYYLNGQFKLDHIAILEHDLRRGSGKPSAEVIVQFTEIKYEITQRDILWIHPNLSRISNTVINHDKLVITYTTKDGECYCDKYHVFVQQYVTNRDGFIKESKSYSIELA